MPLRHCLYPLRNGSGKNTDIDDHNGAGGILNFKGHLQSLRIAFYAAVHDLAADAQALADVRANGDLLIYC
ncbi:hypothetical protein BG74_00350 [Sodalis-like endosymbiont of Proechinophthirus fluctus]|nr:hypothetical protein BG74_00350 [Sodalis-like endosymbiont of Proechinophthirus fluctus]